jgi:hypothetical protein
MLSFVSLDHFTVNRMLSVFIERLETADAHDRRRVYEQLWLEMTIAGRIVWSSDSLDTLEKLDCLKWINEIQHCVWGAHADPTRISPGDLYATLQHHAAQASALKSIVDAACIRSLSGLARPDSQPE